MQLARPARQKKLRELELERLVDVHERPIDHVRQGVLAEDGLRFDFINALFQWMKQMCVCYTARIRFSTFFTYRSMSHLRFRPEAAM